MGFLCVLFLQIQLYTDSPFFLCLLPLFSLRYPFEVNGLNLRKCPKTYKGKSAENVNGSKITYRLYLQDADFAVILEIPEDFREEFVSGIQCPKWDIYLGRKSCVPTRPVFQGIFRSYEEALQTLDASLATDDSEKRFIVTEVSETTSEDPEGMLLYDVPVEFGEHKKYSGRYVKITNLSGKR